MLVCTQTLLLTGDAQTKNTKVKENEEFVRTSSFSLLSLSRSLSHRLGVCVYKCVCLSLTKENTSEVGREEKK